jgi:hypothetical protein
MNGLAISADGSQNKQENTRTYLLCGVV